MELAKIIRKARLSKDVTLKIAAKNIKISPSYLHALERGTNTAHPKMPVVRDLADYYALPYDDICIAANRIPADVFDKIVKHKALLQVIRNYSA